MPAIASLEDLRAAQKELYTMLYVPSAMRYVGFDWEPTTQQFEGEGEWRFWCSRKK
jgi:hypothetical protein